ncbi:MAG: type IV pilus assembly protein PilM [Planctomycetota bacterium]
MAGQSSVWGIDLGQCALKAVHLSFDAKKDRAVALAFDYIEHPKILSQPDADPEELIKSALEKFLSRNDVKDSTVYISVPGQAGLARFVKLPPVKPAKVPEIVQFEAKQQIPFPLEDVVWDYQKIGGGEEQEEEGLVLETEVGIFAIKRDMIQRHLAPFEKMGIEVHVVQLAPVALYNFAAFDYFYHGHKAKQQAKANAEAGAEPKEDAEEEEGDTLVLLDMGADKTDVVITDGDAIWLRNLPIGGNHFTRALTKEFKLTFAKAEHLKRNATKAPDPKKLYQAMRPVFTDFLSELQRSVGYFASTHRHQVIKTVLGVGNGFRLPGIQRFLQQNLQYEIIKLTEYKGLEGEEVLTAPAFAENLPGFGVAYGLALQGLHQTPIQTNLLPREIQNKRLVRDKKPWSLAAAAAILLGCIGIFYGHYRVYSKVHAETFKAPEQRVKGATDRFKQWAAGFDEAVKSFDAKKMQGEDLSGLQLVDNRLGWIKVLKAINDAVPPRKSDSDDHDLAKVPEVNIEYITAEYTSDLGTWFSKFNETQLKTMSDQDRAAGPGGPGWVFRILGYTFHDDFIIYVQDSILANLKKQSMRDQGITHPVVVQHIEDFYWTPEKGSKLADMAKQSSTSEGFFKPTIAKVQSTRSNMGNNAAASGNLQNLNAQKSSLPPDMIDYQVKSEQLQSKRGGAEDPNGEDDSSLIRTDFEIQFVWVPPAPKGPEGEAAPQAPPPAPSDAE